MEKSLKKKALLILGLLMVSGGLFLFSYYILEHYGQRNDIPYKYILKESGPPSRFPGLNIIGNEDLFVTKYETKLTALDKPVAVFYTGERKGGSKVIIDHKSDSPFPIITLPVDNEVYQALYKEILKNTGGDDLLMSWWDNCLRIKLFTGRAVLVEEHIGYPVIIPDILQKHASAITDFEKKFWKSRASGEGDERFRKYAGAMVSGMDEGYAILKDLSKGRKTFIVVDFRDLLNLSEFTKGKFNVEYREFSATGDIHGTIKHVKVWLNEKGIKDYMAEPLSNDSVRAYYLPKEEDKDKLIVKLLPFTSSNPFSLEKFKLRYQKGSIYVYELI